jgi:hypothetical protein
VLSHSFWIFSFALFGKNGFIGVGPSGHKVQAGFGIVGAPVGGVRTVATRRLGFGMDVAANARGRAAIVFQKDRGQFLAVRSPGRGRFVKPFRISGRAHALSDAVVKVNSRGDVLVVWTASVPGSPHRSPIHAVMARVLTASGRLSPARRLGTGADGFRDDVAVAFTASRRALVAWETFAGARVAYASAGAHFHRAEKLDAFPSQNGEEQSPSAIRVTFSSAGHGVVAWASGTAIRSIRAAILSGNRFGSAQTLFTGTGDANLDSLAAGSHGDVVAAWSELGASPAVAAAVLPSAAATFGPREFVAQGGNGQLAIDPRTDVPFLAFVTNDGLAYSIRTPVG